MNQATKKLKTPLAQAEIEIKDWISVKEAEYIDEAAFSNMDIALKGNRPEVNKINIGQLLTQDRHRAIEKFIVSIDGQTEKVVEKVLELPEEDGAFIDEEIKKRRKKKLPENTQPQP